MRCGSLLICITSGILNGCKNDPASPPYDPVLPTQWAAAVTNTFFPLTPGTAWRYTGVTSEGTETTVVEVLQQSRVINGVSATVVHDAVYLNGVLAEDTYDWFAQDMAGNVWYLGEDTKEYENGRVTSTEGSWEWGVSGALPGVNMWADPAAHINQEYRQEFSRGEAEDWGKVIALDRTVDVPFGRFTGCIQTEDWNGIEGRSDSLEHKYYCPGIGVVLEVSVRRPAEKVELTLKTPR
jgi:hypothetical protein